VIRLLDVLGICDFPMSGPRSSSSSTAGSLPQLRTADCMCSTIAEALRIVGTHFTLAYLPAVHLSILAHLHPPTHHAHAAAAVSAVAPCPPSQLTCRVPPGAAPTAAVQQQA
jgi:hypothetical protein